MEGRGLEGEQRQDLRGQNEKQR